MITVDESFFIQKQDRICIGLKQGFKFDFSLFTLCNLLFQINGSLLYQCFQPVPVFSKFGFQPVLFGDIPDEEP